MAKISRFTLFGRGLLFRKITVKELATHVSQIYKTANEDLHADIYIDIDDDTSRYLMQRLLREKSRKNPVIATLDEIGQAFALLDSEGDFLTEENPEKTKKKIHHVWESKEPHTDEALGVYLLGAFMGTVGRGPTANISPIYEMPAEKLLFLLERASGVTATPEQIENGVKGLKRFFSTPRIFSVGAMYAST